MASCLSNLLGPQCGALWGPVWLAGLTGVGHLNVAVCWINSSVDGLWSDVLMLACALFILIFW